MIKNRESVIRFKLPLRGKINVLDLSEIISINDINSIRKPKRKNDAAIVLQRMSNGYRIVTLEEDKFMEALNFIREGFFEDEPMCKATNLLNDRKSLKTSMKIIYRKLLDMQSCCAIKEGENKIVGIAVASINLMGDLVRSETRIKPNQGDAIFNIMSIKSCVFSKARLYERLDIDKFFRIHLLYVNKDNRNNGIASALINSCIDLATNLSLPACIGGFSSTIIQNIARKLGFVLLAEVNYNDFLMYNDKLESFEIPFERLTNGNNNLACMALPIKLSILSLVTMIDDNTNVKKKLELTANTKSK